MADDGRPTESVGGDVGGDLVRTGAATGPAEFPAAGVPAKPATWTR